MCLIVYVCVYAFVFIMWSLCIHYVESTVFMYVESGTLIVCVESTLSRNQGAGRLCKQVNVQDMILIIILIIIIVIMMMISISKNKQGMQHMS